MKALVLFSGGVDSTTCLALAIKKYGNDEVLALSVYYGQKHDKEIEAAKKIAAYYNVRLKQLDLTRIFEDSDCSLLKGSQQDIPEESYEAQLKKTNGAPVSTYVPFRNGLFLSSAASIALSNGCTEIYYGAHMDDAAGNAYPDCSKEFNNAINSAIYIGSGNILTVTAPFIGMNRSERQVWSVAYHMKWHGAATRAAIVHVENAEPAGTGLLHFLLTVLQKPESVKLTRIMENIKALQ